ncbi:AAA family ATPase [Hyalangium gracile]|uniref:AAA family ATPase n=1 Tax=Hyalangium gracile TaxID=394092 RepID=UPI001CCD482F|nr:ATP-binding protein [Hyalangium gracile]
MITEIEVKNFKTLRDVKIPLAPGITVMVGANNSGKSNALAVLKLLSEGERHLDYLAATSALGGMQSVLARDAADPVRVVLRTRRPMEEERIYGFQLTPDGRKAGEWLAKPQFRYGQMQWDRLDLRHEQTWMEHLRKFLEATTVHDLSVAALRAPAIVRQDAKLGTDGKDAAAVLDRLAGEHPSLRDAIDETVQRAAHEVKRIVTRPGPEPGTKVLGVEEKDGRVYGAEDVSDGLLLFIGVAVAAQLRASTPCILAIEEPERGIHPRRLRDLVDHLLRLTKSGVQVVLTTHSPTLLDEFRDTPESVLIFDRDEKGTHVTHLSDRPDWAEQLKGAPLGELWYSGVLGGVPGR